MLKRVERALKKWAEETYPSVALEIATRYCHQWLSVRGPLLGSQTEVLRVFYDSDGYHVPRIAFSAYSLGSLHPAGTSVELDSMSDTVVRRAVREAKQLITSIVPLLQAEPDMGQMKEARGLLRELAKQYGWALVYRRSQFLDYERKHSFEAVVFNPNDKGLSSTILSTQELKVVGSCALEAPAPHLTNTLRLNASIHKPGWQDSVREFAKKAAESLAQTEQATP